MWIIVGIGEYSQVSWILRSDRFDHNRCAVTPLAERRWSIA